MFFTGDSSARKRVDLGGRSSKERDRKVLLEQTRLERKRRLGLRQESAAALKIQKCFRGRKTVAVERSKVREQFFNTFGDSFLNVDRNCFSPDSEFLRQLLFFFKANNRSDFDALVETCRKLLQFIRGSGDVVSIVAGKDYSAKHAVVDHRVRQLSYFCLQAVHQNRNQLKEQLLMASQFSNLSAAILLETVVTLTNPELPWACKIVDDLARRKAFSLLHDIILAAVDIKKVTKSPGTVTLLERVIISMASHIRQDRCCCSSVDPQWSFSSQILSVPFLWRHFPHLKEVFATRPLGKHYMNQMALCLHNHSNVLPADVSNKFPGYACLLGNLLETAGVALSQPFCTRGMAMDFAAVASYLLEALPPTKASTKQSSVFENEMIVDDEDIGLLNPDLERQISNAIDHCLLEHLVNSLFRDAWQNDLLLMGGPSDEELTAVGSICSFLHVTFSILPLERIVTVLAYRTDIVRILWNFIKRCHDSHQWPSFSKITTYLSGDAPGWLLPLAVFCPVYKHMLMIIDNEEFDEQEKPLSFEDIRCLIIILRQALWELLWLIPGNVPASHKCSFIMSNCNKVSVDTIKHKVKLATSELLSQLQDWNNRRPFTSFSDFHAEEAIGETFISQALIGNTRAHDILKHAPFLVPFTSRVKIFTSQLAAARQRDGHDPAFARHRFKIRRNQIFEDAFNQLRLLSEEELRGMIRVSFINEVGAEEAGIDGGGIFKDFMENITRAAFDVQYGLFKNLSRTGQLVTVFCWCCLLLGGGDLDRTEIYNLAKQLNHGNFFHPRCKVPVPHVPSSTDGTKQCHVVPARAAGNFDPCFHFSLETTDHLLYPNPGSGMIHEQHLQFFHFLGTLIGKAMFEGILVDIPFATFFLSKLKQKYNYLNDLPSLDSELYRHLLFLKHYKGDVSDLELYFVVVNNDYGEQREEELISGGKNIRVTKENVITFIHLIANYRLNFQIRLQSLHFLRGFQQLIQKEWIEMFNEHEIQLLISGSSDGIDIDDLCSNVHYSGGYHQDHVVIQMFWEVIRSFSLEYQKKFLKFVTGCSRGPLLGFKYLEPKFCIQRAAPQDVTEEDLDRLPTSATCMNLLKLPPYRSKEQLQTKLLYAISADAGFDLS